MKPLSLRSTHLDALHSLATEMLALPLDLIGAHTRLLALASVLADGGRIAGCKGWSVPRWYGSVGFHPRLLKRLGETAPPLVRWEGEDLLVAHYNLNHENRIRWLVGHAYDMTAKRMAEEEQRRTAGISNLDYTDSRVSRQRVNCAKVLRTGPTVLSNSTVQQHSRQNPDPRSLLEGDIPSDRRPDHPFEEGSDPPDPPPHEDRERVSRSGGSEALSRPRDPGPEGFEAFLAAMPVPKERQPRDPRVWPKWIDRMLRHWVREDLEGEAPEILAEVERMKLIEEKQRKPRMVPSGINFLRAASWRRRRPAKPRPKPAAAAEVLADASDSWKGSTPTTREELEAFVRGVINAREHHS